MAKDRINRDELADKLVERAAKGNGETEVPAKCSQMRAVTKGTIPHRHTVISRVHLCG